MRISHGFKNQIGWDENAAMANKSNSDNTDNKRPRARGGAAKVLPTSLDGTTHIRVTTECANQISRLVAKRVLNGRTCTKQQAIEDAIMAAIADEDNLTRDITTKILRRAGKVTMQDVKAS